MSTEWNDRRNEYRGKSPSWDGKDNIQRILTIIQWDTVDVLNTTLEYKYVLEFFDSHLDYINSAPCFWGEVVKSLRFTLIMKFAKLFDESANAIGIKKLFNILEQSEYRDCMIDTINIARQQYNEYAVYINEIRTIRDKIYAHNDKKTYFFWKYPSDKDLEFEGDFWERIEEILVWIRDTILELRVFAGDGYPINIEIRNDLESLLRM